MSEPAPRTYAFGRFRFAPGGSLTLDGAEIPLKSRERQLLAMLLEQPDRWIPEDRLATQLWPRAVPAPEELEHLVRGLRAILDRGADGVTTIRSQRGQGHRLDIPVHEVEPAAAAAAPRVPPPSGARPLPEAGSAHKRWIQPRRFALLLFAAAAVAAALGWALSWAARKAENGAPTAAADNDPGTVRLAASAELAKGIAAARRFDGPSVDEAIGFYEAAIAIEPGFAAARGALAAALVQRSELAAARRQAEVALVLDPELAEAHAALAMVRLFADWNPSLARAAAESARAASPSLAAGRRALAWVLAAEGRFDAAIDELRGAAPAAFDAGLVADEAWFRLYSGRTFEARQLAAEVSRREPAFARPRETLAAVHLLERRLGRAEMELELRDRLLAGASARDERIRMSVVGGIEPPEANEGARLLRARAEAAASSVSPNAWTEAARIFVQLGDREPAFAALGRAVARREPQALFARYDPAFAPLQGTSRFRDLLARALPAAEAAPREGS